MSPAVAATRRRLRLALALVIGGCLALMAGSTAHADPAAPTDYRTEIVAIEPPTDGLALQIIGGDSFVQLTVERGVDIVVIGYQGEPYLWFRPDGTVAENQRSPSTFLNASRYGDEPPVSASADEAPEWRDVADDGSFAWYDHRAHWMLQIRPAGKSAGDQILESVIPLVVDRTDVRVTVTSTWVPSPSPLPMVMGVLAGLATAVAAFLGAPRTRFWPITLAPITVSAVIVGWWQYLSLPSETDPRLIWLLAPTVALGALVVAIAVAGRRRLGAVTDLAVLVATIALILWAVVKRDGIGAAIIPTDAPQWLDRATVAAAFVAGLGVGVVLFARVLRASGTISPRATT